jgi:hypothetical protein
LLYIVPTLHSAAAAAVPVYDGYDKEGYENDEGSYKYDGDYYTDKPECGPEQFPELKDALCVNTKTGVSAPGCRGKSKGG